MTAGKALVLGDDTRSFLATIRSLGRQGIIVHAAPANFRSPALRSRYIATIHDLPPWLPDGTDWLRAIEALLRVERFDLVIPCNETTLLPLQRHRAEIEALVRLAIPDDHAIALLFDKYATRDLARRVGVPVATGRLLRSDDTAAGVMDELGAAVVAKPRWSYSLKTLASRGKARIVRDVGLLTEVIQTAEPDEILLEQFFPGRGIGVSVLASKGRVLQAFEHHRVRELDGASFYRISAPLTPDLVHACEAIVAAVPYTGVAMFEFKRNDSGEWILLEVNARPWGSMPLPLALGIDFPYRWYRLLTAGEETPSMGYPVGVYGRNLIPDLQASWVKARTSRLGPVATAWFMAGRVGELLRSLTGREKQDVLVRDDPRPGWVELLKAMGAVWQRARRTLPGATARQQRWARAQVARLVRNGAEQRVIFVCQGNICRSPFAAALLRARLGTNCVTAVASAGMMPQPGRKTPKYGRLAATAFGIDLSGHRSAWLTREAAEHASLLVVFDETNRAAVFDRYPDLRVPVIRLGELSGSEEITDPVDGGPAVFDRCYQHIAKGVETLVTLLPRRI